MEGIACRTYISIPQQMQYLGPNLKEGDVILTNHPAAGGSHLPDLTVITPVCYTQYIYIHVCTWCFGQHLTHILINQAYIALKQVLTLGGVKLYKD